MIIFLPRSLYVLTFLKVESKCECIARCCQREVHNATTVINEADKSIIQFSIHLQSFIISNHMLFKSVRIHFKRDSWQYSYPFDTRELESTR